MARTGWTRSTGRARRAPALALAVLLAGACAGGAEQGAPADPGGTAVPGTVAGESRDGSGPTGETTRRRSTAGSSTTVSTSAPPSTTTSTTTPDAVAMSLEPLLVPPVSATVQRRDDTGLTPSDLAARPFVGTFDEVPGSTPEPVPELLDALDRSGFEGAIRGDAYSRSYPASSSITIARFATPEGATTAAGALTRQLLAAPDAVDLGPVDGIPGSTTATASTPPQTNPVYDVMGVAIFVHDRFVVTVARIGTEIDSDALGASSLALLQRDRIVAGGGPSSR